MRKIKRKLIPPRLSRNNSASSDVWLAGSCTN